jgi:hypothetical protein
MQMHKHTHDGHVSRTKYLPIISMPVCVFECTVHPNGNTVKKNLKNNLHTCLSKNTSETNTNETSSNLHAFTYARTAYACTPTSTHTHIHSVIAGRKIIINNYQCLYKPPHQETVHIYTSVHCQYHLELLT